MLEGARIACAFGVDPARAYEFSRRALVATLTRWHDMRHRADLERVFLARLVRARVGASRQRPRDDLEAAWLSLPRRTRAFLTLSIYAELTEERVADVWGCSSATVRSVTARAWADLPSSSDRLADLLRARAELIDADAPLAFRGLRLRRAGYLLAVIAAIASASAMAVWVASSGIEVSDVTPSAREAPTAGESSFEMAACLEPAGTLPVAHRFAVGANRAAISFGQALTSGDAVAAQGLIDPSAIDVPIEEWGRPASRRGLHVTGSRSAGSDGLAILSCGREVAARSWKVYIHDGTNTASAGLAVYYLARRPEGWRVWGSYKPGA